MELETSCFLGSTCPCLLRPEFGASFLHSKILSSLAIFPVSDFPVLLRWQEPDLPLREPESEMDKGEMVQ